MATLPTLIGPYRLIRKLGEGGMGEVYEGRHETIERQVAIKVLHPQYARDAQINQRFLNEARAVNLINHPGLVQISDLGQLGDGRLYIVMEYLPGETLRQRLKSLGGWLPVSQVLYITWQVASALVAAHAVGITHRDLKPDNVMLVADPITPTGERAKLLDFGIARLATDTLGGHSLTGSSLLGTPIYMSPEQCRGAGAVGTKSDVYSLGVMLYQLLAGRPPFVSVGVGDVIHMHLSQEPPPLRELAPDVPGELAAVVHRLLLKNQDQRPGMLEVMAELEQLQLRLGSTEIEVVSAAPGSAPYFGTSGAQLSDSLAGILGPELEEEELQPDGGATGTAARAYEPSVASGPGWPAESQPTAKGGLGQPTVATTRPSSRELAATFISGRNSLDGSGAHRQPPARQPVLESVMPAAVVIGGVIAAATWLLLPMGVVVHRPVPPPAPIAAAAVGARPERSPVPTSPAAKPTVSWSVNTLPSGAKVVRADTNEVLGMTPWRTEPAKRLGSLVVRLGKPGFADKEVLLDYNQSRYQMERLSELPGTQARPPSQRGSGEKQNPQADPARAKSSHVSPKPHFEFIE